MRMQPVAGDSSPAIARNSVDFPAPLGPKIPVTVPATAPSCTPLSTVFAP